MVVVAVVVVLWSAWSPSTPTLRVRIPLKSTFLFCKMCEKNENKQKGPEMVMFKKRLIVLKFCKERMAQLIVNLQDSKRNVA